MERYLSNPNVDKTVVNTIQVYEGGTGGTTVKEAQDNLDILDKITVGAPNGLAIMPTNGLFGGSIEGGVSDTPMIDGPSYVRTNQTNKFFITNYDIKTDYLLSTDMGSITREEDYLVFKSGPDVGVATIRVNNLEVKLDIFLALINMPNITYPASGDDTINSKVEVKTTEFITGEVNTFHAYTDWELSTTVTMDNIFKSVEKSANFLTNWKVEGLQENVTYYIRFRYWDNVGNKSSWSEITQFKTRQRFTPQTPVIEIPANGTKELRADVSFTTSDFFTYEEATHVSSDWQVSTSSVFAGLIEESQADEVDLTTWSIGGLSTNTLYYVRVRHTDNKGRTSDWSLPSRFTTRKSFSADTPTIVGPVNQSDNHNSSLTISASYFTNGDSRVTHQSSDWEISEDNSFQYPFLSSYSNSTAKVEWICKGLQPMTTYFVRVRYRDTMGFVTEWSKPIEFTTKVSFAPQRPNITDPGNGTTEVGPWLDLRTSAYVSNNTGDSHLNSDWEIGSSLTFKDLLKWNTGTIDDKIGWRVKGLEEASQYFVRVRHRSIVDGEEYVSDWSPVVNFTTKFSFAPGKPTITYPKSGSKDISENVTITSNNYIPSDSQDVHVNSDWEIATNSSFTDIVESNYGSAVAKTAWVVTNLRSLTTFFVRVRHRTINDGIYYVSEWSSVNNFTVEHEVPATPVILTPSNGSSRVPTNTMVTCSSYVAGEVEEKHFSSSWEISTTASFSPVVASSINSTTNKVSWTPAGLQANTNYFVRVKHIGSLGFESGWSDASQFTTKSAAVSSTPSIVSPSNGATNVNTTTTVTSSSFSSSDSGDTHLSSDWELATDSSFSTKVKTSTGSSADKTSWNLSGLAANVTYYVRVRHNGSDSGSTGWSSTSSFSTKAPDVIGQTSKPNITSPTNNATGLGTSFQVTASAFSSTLSGDTHNTSDWEVGTDSSFGSVVKSSYDSATSRTSWSVGGLVGGSTFYVRVRYKGLKGGLSPWSDGVKFTTRGGGGGTDPGVTVINEVKNFMLKPGTVVNKDATLFFQNGRQYNQVYDGTEIDAPISLFSATDSGITSISSGTAGRAKVFGGSKFSEDDSRYSFASVRTGPASWGDLSQANLLKDNFNTDVPLGYVDPDYKDSYGTPQDISMYGGGISGDSTLKTIVRGCFNTLYLFKERDTDTGVKMAFISKVKAPAEYEAQGLGQSVSVSDDGKIVFAFANANVIYIFSIDDNTLTFRYRLRLQGHDLHTWDIDSQGSTLVVSPKRQGYGNAYVYERSGTAYEWTLKSTLSTGSPHPVATSSCITADGNKITASGMDGAYGVDKEPIHTVFWYNRSGTSWTLEKKHTPTVPDIGDPSTIFDPDFLEGSTQTRFLYTVNYAYHLTSRDGNKTLLNGTIYGIPGTNKIFGDNVYIMTTTGGGTSPESVSTPSITSPSSGSSLSPDGVTFTASAFSSSSSSATHSNSDWEISTNSAFTSIVKSAYASTTEKTSWSVSGLTAGATYYVRVKHTSSSGKDSAWSNTISFSTTTVSVPGANGIVKYDIASQFVSSGAFPVNWSVIFSKNTDLFSTHSSFSTWGGVYDGSAYSGHSYLKRHEVKSDGTFNTEVIREAMTMSSVSGTRIDSVNGAWSTSDKSKQAYYGVITALTGQYGEPSPSATFLVGSGAGTGFYGGVSTDKAYAPPDGKLPTDPDAIGAYNTPFINAIDVNYTFDTIVYSWGGSTYQKNSTVKIKYSLQGDDGSRVGLFSGPLEIPAGSIPTGFGWMVGISGNGNVVFVHSGSNWVYIYQRDNTGVNWAFVEKIQLPNEAYFFEISETGDKMVVGNKTWFACTVVSKKNGSWNNFTLIEPIGSAQIPSTYFVRGTRCSISSDGTVVSVGVVKEKGFEVHFYREQPDGSWGSIKVIQLSIPDIGTLSSFDVNHMLSFDGTTCMMMEPNYTVSAPSGIGDPVLFHGKACLAY